MMSHGQNLYPRLGEGVGFSNWKFRVKILLEEKGLSKILEVIVSNDDKSMVEKDARAKSIIVQCLSDKFLEYIKKCSTAADMMKQLESVFERKSIFNKLYLRKKLLALKCVPTDKMQDHFLKFDTIITELESSGTKIEECDKVCHLLLTLPSLYDTVITALETMSDEKELTIDFVKSRLLDAELKLKEKDTQPSSQESSFLSCFKCGMQGHKSYQCNTQIQQPNTMRGRNPRSRYRGRVHRGTSRGRFHGPMAKITENIQEDRSDSMFVALTSEHYNEDNQSLFFVVDSGATHHFIQDKYIEYMTNVEALNEYINIKIANGENLVAKQKGILKVFYRGEELTIEGLIVENLSHNLLSVNRLLEKNFTVIFKNGILKIYTKDKTYYGEKRRKLYVLKLKLPNTTHYCQHTYEDKNIWHKRLGHVNRKGLAILNLPSDNKICDTCMRNKSTRLPFKPVIKARSHAIGDLIHTDIAGPMRVETKEGYRYYLTIMDDYSHFSQTYLLKNKSEAADNLKGYIQVIEREKGIKVKRIHCDNGGEYTSNMFKNYCKDKGIVIEYTLPYSPQMNGKSERLNRTIYDKARTILDQSNLPRYLWGEAVLTATYLINRCPSKSINNRVPAKIFGKEMNLQNLRIFGAKGWMVIIPKRDKFDERAIPVRMLGYAKTGYKVWDPRTDTVVVTRDVRFDENDIKYESENKEKNINKMENNNDTYIEEDIQCKSENKQEVNEQGKSNANDENETDMSPVAPDIVNHQDQVISRSKRIIKRPAYLNDYQLYQAYCLISSEEEPQTYDKATETGWNEAIEIELNAHKEMNTWTVTDLPKDKEAIDAKWIFKVKENGLKKARLVARGFQIREEKEFGTNYAPVARTSTVKTLLAHAVHNSLPIRQLDVPTAFLNGNLESEVYIKAPPGVIVEKNKVLKLNRGLYGLRESPKCWNERFDCFMTKNGFTRSQYDYCLYYKRNIKVWLLIYVDDIILTGTEENIVTIVKELKEEFRVKDLGSLNLFLGMEIQRTDSTLKITQSRHIEKMLQKFGMKDCKGSKTPLTKGYQFDEKELIIEDVPYRQLIGSLMFIATVSRPDIAYSVSYLSQYLDRPTKSLWTQAKRCLRYLKETSNLGLLFKRTEQKCIETYSDSDWAGNISDRKSVSGSVTLYNGCTVTWISRKQNCVALSTVEAEYIAGATSACDLLYIKGLYYDFNTPDSDIKCVLYMDNKGAIQLSKSFENSKRAKHIDIRNHFLKDLIIKKELIVKYISTDDNLSDLCTKSLSSERLTMLRKKLNVC